MNARENKFSFSTSFLIDWAKEANELKRLLIFAVIAPITFLTLFRISSLDIPFLWNQKTFEKKIVSINFVPQTKFNVANSHLNESEPNIKNLGRLSLEWNPKKKS